MLDAIHGKKTAIAVILGYVAYSISAYQPEIAEMVREFAMGLGTWGVSHKLIKMK